MREVPPCSDVNDCNVYDTKGTFLFRFYHIYYFTLFTREITMRTFAIYTTSQKSHSHSSSLKGEMIILRINVSSSPSSRCRQEMLLMIPHHLRRFESGKQRMKHWQALHQEKERFSWCNACQCFIRC